VWFPTREGGSRGRNRRRRWSLASLLPVPGLGGTIAGRTVSTVKRVGRHQVEMRRGPRRASGIQKSARFRDSPRDAPRGSLGTEKRRGGTRSERPEMRHGEGFSENRIVLSCRIRRVRHRWLGPRKPSSRNESSCLWKKKPPHPQKMDRDGFSLDDWSRTEAVVLFGASAEDESGPDFASTPVEPPPCRPPLAGAAEQMLHAASSFSPPPAPNGPPTGEIPHVRSSSLLRRNRCPQKDRRRLHTADPRPMAECTADDA